MLEGEAGASWSPETLAASARLSWAKPLRKVVLRAAAIAAAGPSPAVRAQHWNTYMVSGIPVPRPGL